MIYTGLDWSGDAGDPSKSGRSPLLVIVAVHVAREELDALDEALARARRARQLPANYCFKYNGSRPEIRAAFFTLIPMALWAGHATVIDKRDWSIEYLRGRRGRDRINDGIVTVIVRCPDDIVAGQVLLVDAPREEMAVVNETRAVLRSALAGVGRRSFGKVKPRQDNRPDGAIVQVADMVAGALHADRRMAGPYLAPLDSRIKLVG